MRVVLHYLVDSLAHRILWLFEELKVPYELKIYTRDKWGNPPELYKALHPVAAKCPVIEIVDWDGGRKKMAESGHIISYLLRLFDPKKVLSFNSTIEKEQCDFFFHYAEASLLPVLDSLLADQILVNNSPFGFQGIILGITSMIGGKHYAQELEKHLHYLESVLEQQHQQGLDYIVGQKFSLADMMIAYPLLTGTQSPALLEHLYGPNFVMGTQLPHLQRYQHLLEMNSLLIRANEVLQEVLTRKQSRH